jgi:aromatic-L-amino-acid decarboxylase
MHLEQLQQDFAELQSELISGPIVPRVTVEEIRSHLCSDYDFASPSRLVDVVADVEQMLRTWQVQVTHPRYFGLFNPSVTLSSVIADVLVAMYNPQLANWRTSPAANEMERHTLTWLAAKFGLPAEAAASFTSGGSEANLSAVVVALTHAFSGYGECGLRALPRQPVIYLTEEVHQSFNKIAHMTGLGRESLRIVRTDGALRLVPDDLAARVDEDRREGLAPFMVIASAGTTAAGVIDPLVEIGSFCSSAGLWFHVDAAWGGAAVVSSKLRPHLSGIEKADSITCDAHKWFSVPMGAGMFFCRYPEMVAQAFRADLSYMPRQANGPERDPYTNSVQWSRRFIGLKLFLSLAEHGEAGYAEMIDHQTEMGHVLRRCLLASGWRILNQTPLPLVCFTREQLDTSKLLTAMREEQIAWMSEAHVAGTPAVRACVTSFRTTESDVRWVVSEMTRIAEHHSNVPLVSYSEQR